MEAPHNTESLQMSWEETLKLPLGKRIFNFVNFESLIYIKLYNLLILNKIQKCYKNNVKPLKKTKQFFFQDVYCHVNKFAVPYHNIDEKY